MSIRISSITNRYHAALSPSVPHVAAIFQFAPTQINTIAFPQLRKGNILEKERSW